MPAMNGSRIFRITSALLYARPRAFVRRERSLATHHLRHALARLLLHVVRAAHVNYLGAEGLENFLHDGVSLGALAQMFLFTPRLVLGANGFVPRVARRSRLDVDADASAQNV